MVEEKEEEEEEEGEGRSELVGRQVAGQERKTRERERRRGGRSPHNPEIQLRVKNWRMYGT